MDALRASLRALAAVFDRLPQLDRRALMKGCASGRDVTWCALVKGAMLGKPRLVRRAVSARHALNQQMIATIQKAHVELSIADFGSRNPWSDYDYQVSFDLFQLDFRAFTSVVAAVQEARQSIAGLSEQVFPGTRVPTDNLIEVNWYLPTLLFKAPPVKVRRLLQPQYFAVEQEILALCPQLDGQAGAEFLKKDCLAIFRGRRTNLDSCYSRYGRLWPTFVKVREILQGSRTGASFNNLLLQLVKLNPVCADMYFGVSTVLFVVVHMQLCKGRSKLKNLPLLAIPAAVENQLMFGRTGKAKYLERTKAALRVLDKRAAVEIIDQALSTRAPRTERDRLSLLNLVHQIV